MNTVWLVASREFTERLRSRSFLISNAAIMFLVLAASLLPARVGDEGATALGHLGGETLQVAQLALAQQAAFDVELEIIAFDGRAAAEEGLESGEVEAVLLDPTTALVGGNLGPRLEAALANASNAHVIDGPWPRLGSTRPSVRACSPSNR